MKLQLVSPRQGFVWVQRAFQVCARQPLGFAALLAARKVDLPALGRPTRPASAISFSRSQIQRSSPG